MLKNKKIIIALIVLFAAFIDVKVAAVKSKSPDIKAFDVSEYQSYIDVSKKEIISVMQKYNDINPVYPKWSEQVNRC